jgi:membrane protease YdiL (CAAX protease family)
MTRIAWAVLALVFAPLVEEFFFRGLLLRGFTSSWGRRIGGLIVTLLFIATHLFETFNYWPATLAILFLGIITLLARWSTGSLLPALAAHLAYNSIIVVAVFA